jgi:arylsulfatase
MDPTGKDRNMPGYGRREFLKNLGCGSLGLAGTVSLGALTSCRASSPARPNIMILFADDLGFSDIGCFGGEIATPNLDALAGGGVRFSQFYNAARCCPSRASLLTGLYAHQAGIGWMVYRDLGEGYRGNLNESCVTIGDVLKGAGYRTMFVGKWHAGHAPASRPEVRGFESVTGIYSHIDSYWKVLEGCDVYRDGEILIPAGEDPVNPYHPDEEFYTTDFFTDAALESIDRAGQTPDRPFLLHLCYNAPHFPLEAPEDLIAKYRGRYMKGWDALREEKFLRMRDEIGIVGEGQRLPEVRRFRRERRGVMGRSVETAVLPDWASLSGAEQRELDFRRAMYAAQVERLDWNIGRLVRRLEQKGILDDTLILFLSDNGCSGEDSVFGMHWGDYTADNYSEWRKAGGWSISQGQCWASASNTPLRKYKLFTHEGGIATPFIAHWPRGIRQKGRVNTDQAFHIIDILPTLCELAGAAYPEEHKGRPIRPAAGQSMLPWLRNVRRSPRERTLFWQHETCSAVRRGGWKLVTTDDRDQGSWELYDLSRDRSETDNMIEEEPELALELRGLWREWAGSSDVLPFPEDRESNGETR